VSHGEEEGSDHVRRAIRDDSGNNHPPRVQHEHPDSTARVFIPIPKETYSIKQSEAKNNEASETKIEGPQFPRRKSVLSRHKHFYAGPAANSFTIISYLDINAPAVWLLLVSVITAHRLKAKCAENTLC